MLNVKNPLVSRIDVCFDFFSTTFSFDDVSDKEWISQANQINSFLIHGQRSGFKFGKKGIVCRVYDKTREIKEQSHKYYLYDIWKSQGWDGESPVWRVEYEFHTAFLKILKLREIDKAVSHQDALWKFATEEWLKLVIPNPNDSNRSRWNIHPVWSEIQEATSQGSEPLIKEVEKTRLPTNETLFVNGLGYFISFMASRRITDPQEALRKYLNEAEQFYEFKGTSLKATLRNKINERAKRFNIPIEELYDD